MSTQPQHPASRQPRSLKHQALWVFVLIAILAIGNVLAIQTMQRRADHISATISVASKMRMLSHRIALETLVQSQAPDGNWPAVDKRYQEFEQAYSTLLNGGEIYGRVVQAAPTKTLNLLHALYPAWMEYRTIIDNIYSRTPLDKVQVLAVMAASDFLWAHSEALIDGMVDYSSQLQKRTLAASWALFAMDILLLLAGFLIFQRHLLRPLHQLERHAQAMASGNYSTRSPLFNQQELDLLSTALNQSAEHIGKLISDVSQEKENQQKTQAMFDGLASNQVAGIYMLDGQMNIVYANQQLAQMMGYPTDAFGPHFPLAKLFLEKSFDGIKQRVLARLEGRAHSERYEETAVRADGSQFEVEVFGTAMHTPQGRAVIGMMLDISDRKKAEKANLRAALIFQHANEAMVITDPDGVVQDVNPSFTKITGYTPQEIIGYRLNLISSGKHDQAFYQNLWSCLKQNGVWSGDIHNRRKNGKEYIERLTITSTYNQDGSISGHIGLFSDVTELREREATIWRQAHYDLLTQLPNRQMFQQNLLRSIEEARQGQRIFALVFLDLDFFKEVNDTFGHDEGDELLCQVAARLQDCVRSTDMVARLGGDEFTLILHGIKHNADVHPICKKILHAIAQPYILSNHTVKISVSIGVTFYPHQAKDGITLLKQADLAMYAAKAKGRNQYCFFDPIMEEQAQSRRLLLRDLQLGLERQEFELHYQPIVEMSTKRTIKAEALVRWQQPERGRVGPDAFIPLAEESGLIVPLGDWIFTTAVQQLSQWRKVTPDFGMSINVSPVQLLSAELNHQHWLRAIHALALPGHAITLEVTERVLLESDQLSDSKLQQLLAADIQLALDDFGTGYSSLSYLKRLELDLLKIDRSFVLNLHRDSEDLVLCQAIIVMAHQLGLKVVAEGVETEDQHLILLEAGCDYGQGYWYSRPLPAKEFEQRLREEENFYRKIKNQPNFDI